MKIPKKQILYQFCIKITVIGDIHYVSSNTLLNGEQIRLKSFIFDIKHHHWRAFANKFTNNGLGKFLKPLDGLRVKDEQSHGYMKSIMRPPFPIHL